MNLQLFFTCTLLTAVSHAQNILNNPGADHGNKFEQLWNILPSPNEYRTASGAPGPKYWQQKADYSIQCELDEKKLLLTGSETIIYYNTSPDPLTYLWFQLDENEHSTVNNANYQYSTGIPPEISESQIKKWEEEKTDNGYGVKIISITGASGKKLNYVINRTMMRVDLPAVLKPGQHVTVKIKWNYKISERLVYKGRGGYEYFKDGNYAFTMVQWYPRLCLYTDYKGWENHQFAGKEFALGFNKFKVEFTVPADHVVGATGRCQNYKQNLSAVQWSRWQKAQTAMEPVEIVTLNEAVEAEKSKSNAKKTWVFTADSVRDFAWTSSRKFVWDAMAENLSGNRIMCMSYYGKEAYPLYSKYSTKVIAHTIRTYSKMTFPYPYPVAQSVEANNAMEYPMICFNYGRADENGNFSDKLKWATIGVIIHEVGHNFFPMIVNSNEREWSWMDEGINSFVQYLAEKGWDSAFPSRRGPAATVINYMRLPKDQLEPIMTNVENIASFGNNAYAKTAAGMNILRETIMGRELFDFAFKTYAKRWAFKQPTPADFFRTMEDASAVDLDWFWRGWFYGTDACDIAIDSVEHFIADNSEEYFYQLNFANKGGLIMPIIIEWTYSDGIKEVERIPAQIWRFNEKVVSKAFMKAKEVVSIRLDPYKETPDIDESNNKWVKTGSPARINIMLDHPGN